MVGVAGLLDWLRRVLRGRRLHLVVTCLRALQFALSVLGVVAARAFLAALAGLMLGAPVLKLRGDHLAIVTLGFGEIVRILMNNFDKVGLPWSDEDLQHHQRPLAALPASMASTASASKSGKALELFGMQITGLQLYYFVFLLFTILSIIGVYRLQHSRLAARMASLARRRNRCQGHGHQQPQHQARRLCLRR